jgi:hypothetical protein
MNTSFITPETREKIIQFLVSKAGNYLVPLISGGVAIGITQLASLSPDVAELIKAIDQKAVTTFVWGAILALVNFATNKWLTQDAKVIQSALNDAGAKLTEDGWIGTKTIEAFTEVTKIEAKPVDPVK